MTSARAIRSICIVGDGIVGRSAALAFARALPGCMVEIVAPPADPTALADRLPTSLPSVRRFHALVGIEEQDLVARSIATHSLGLRFEGWSRDAAPWVLAHGDYGLSASGVPFHQLWARARMARALPPFDAFSLAAMLGQAGKFVHPRTDPGSPLATFDYALNLDPEGYAALLAEKLAAVPVRTSACASLTIARDGTAGHIAALILDSGQRVAADLFIDCSGPQRLLASCPDGWVDWSAASPFDRLACARSPSGAPAVLGTIVAHPDGWTATHSLGSATMRCVAGRAINGAEGLAIAPGRLPRPWRGNALAIGDAAMVPDPVLLVQLSLAHNAIERALALLPGRDCQPVETDEYNRLTAQEAARIRDFGALLHLRSGREDGVWAGLAMVAPPPGLARTLDQFEMRGRLPFFEEELFERDQWLAALFGLGILPATIDPAAEHIAPSTVDGAIDRLAASYAEIARHALPYPAYLAQMRAARPR